MNKIKTVVTLLLIMLSIASFAQEPSAQMDSTKLAKYRTEIGLDMTVPNFDTQTINAKVMGSRLACILDYLMENYHQPVYSRKICVILKEQVDPLEKLEFELKKIQFVRAMKSSDVITILFTAWPSKNVANIKQVNLKFYFKNGISESQEINEFFSTMSRYVQRREQSQYQH